MADKKSIKFVKYITIKGKRIYASQYGKKTFIIYV